MIGNAVLYAPNVHAGGGFVLLRALLAAWPEGYSLQVFLDERARARLNLPEGLKAYWVKPSAGSRLKAELTLRAVCKVEDTILCFHGLPPLLPNLGRVIVFQQNRNYLGLNSLRDFPARTAVRLAFERLVSLLCRRNVAGYVVQTPTMARHLVHWFGVSGYGSMPTVRIFPFVNELLPPVISGSPAIEWDFVYAADGEAHKNHRRLLDAWRLLAAQGIRPRLALTLGPRDSALIKAVDDLRIESGANVCNLGQMPHEQVLALYQRSRGMIFPSTSESFGLPLIEAQQLGLPILASELDYVRDVCVPVQTFDPLSSTSMARAVKRFLDLHEPTVTLHSPEEFWADLLDSNLATPLANDDLIKRV